MLFFNRHMATPFGSPHPLSESTTPSLSMSKKTRKATRLRSLATRPAGVERLVAHVDPVTGKIDGSHRKKLRTNLGIVTHDKVDVTYDNWKQVSAAQKDFI